MEICAPQPGGHVVRVQLGRAAAIRAGILIERDGKTYSKDGDLVWIITLSRTKSVLFLQDEVLGGTNSADRLFGARAVIDQLAANGAFGVITIHDLALTDVVRALDGHAINVHFEEYYEHNEMRFDYRMRPGVLSRTNGLSLMLALGLLQPPTAGPPLLVLSC